MTTEITTPTEESVAEIPPPDVEVKPNGKAEKKEKKTDIKAEVKTDAKEDEGDSGKSTPKLSPEMTELRRAEDRTLKDIIEGFGQHTAYKIRVTRVEPKSYKDKASGRIYQTGGFLQWVEGTPIDEKWLQDRFGGGKYELYFRKRGSKGGMEYGGQVTVEIAGEPDLSQLPGVEGQGGGGTAPAAAPSSSSESPGLVKDVLAFMGKQVDKAEERADRGGGGDTQVLTFMREQLAAERETTRLLMMKIDELQKTITAPKPETQEDRVTGRLLDKMIDQDNVRITALRAQYESEIRQLKDQMIEQERRLRDQFDRDLKSREASHEREIALMRQSHENQVTTLKTSQEIALQAARSSYETQNKVSDAETRRLERELADQKDELKELRAKKDKSIPEMVKELNAIKELVGEEGEESSTAEKIVEAITNPDAIAAVGSLIGKPPPQAQPQQPVVPERPVRRVVKNSVTGEKMILEGNQLRPAKKIPPPGTPPEVAALPPIEESEVKRVVEYLENACTAGTDPATVIQSFGTFIPEPIKVAVRDLGGVDQFLIKVAKLPSSSPLLATQAGRNWCRKLSKALAGE